SIGREATGRRLMTLRVVSLMVEASIIATARAPMSASVSKAISMSLKGVVGATIWASVPASEAAADEVVDEVAWQTDSMSKLSYQLATSLFSQLQYALSKLMVFDALNEHGHINFCGQACYLTGLLVESGDINELLKAYNGAGGKGSEPHLTLLVKSGKEGHTFEAFRDSVEVIRPLGLDDVKEATKGANDCDGNVDDSRREGESLRRSSTGLLLHAQGAELVTQHQGKS
ncbi:hypothetical protein ACLOJK_018548, partial [Asimina triloba]